MNNRKAITVLTTIIILFSFAASSYGVFSSQSPKRYQFESIHGQRVPIYGNGLYKNDSVSIAAQAVAQDIVTLVIGIPLLVISLYLYLKGSLKGKLLLTGTLGYFLYTYISYSFLSMYNTFFLVYVILMSSSFFAFTLSVVSFNLDELSRHFKQSLPVKLIGSFLIFIGTVLGLMWLGVIIPPLTQGTIPVQVEHYTTLVIQALDLGFIMPVSILAGVLVIKRRSLGYLLSSVVIIKGITLSTALVAMIIWQLNTGVELGLEQIVIFPLFSLLTISMLVLLLKNVKEVDISH